MKQPRAGFTLFELLVAATIIVLVVGTLVSITNQTQQLIRGTTAKIEQFQDGRLAFEAMTRRISQATLNTYWDYQYQTVSQTIGGKTVQSRVPTRYERGSELRFRSGRMTELNQAPKKPFQPTHGIFFQAPNGYVEDSLQNGAMDHLLNTWGYFVELNSDEDSLPEWLRSEVPARQRFRLMEMMEPSEQFSVYQFQQPRSADWFARPLGRKDRPARPLADNIVALILLPRLAQADEQAQRERRASTLLAPLYRYDSTQASGDAVLNSKHQLPPVVQVVMIAIDEASAERIARENTGRPALGLEYGTLFTRPDNLEDDPKTATPADGDIQKFTAMLTDKFRASSRVFSTNVSIRGAKWSRSQEY
jgi:uncharacterized protein (TIGR02599 family)